MTWTARFGMVRAIPTALVFVFGASANAGVVQNVNSPGLQYADIQQAVDAAANGDVLLVSSGIYPPFSIDGKSLTLAAIPGAIVSVSGTITVRNVPADGEVDLLGISANPPVALPGIDGLTALVLSNNAGHVRIADGAFRGASAQSGVPSGNAGGTGIAAVGCSRVVLIRCTVQGGLGNWNYCPGGFGITYAGAGGDGLRTQGSILSIHGGDFRGGAGGNGEAYAGDGGTGFRAIDERFLASGAHFQGGAGGNCAPGDCGWESGDGGDGIWVGVGPSKLLDVTAIGAPAGTAYWPARVGIAGVAIDGPGIVVNFAGNARTLSASRIASDATSTSLDISGEPGELVMFADSSPSTFAFVPPLSGTWLVAVPSFYSHSSCIGAIGPSGGATLPFLTPPLSAQPASVRRTLQCLLLAPGKATLSDPQLQVLIDRSAPPDCNGNGVNDFFDVIEGTSFDINTNLVPDECDYGGPDWYVDLNAPPGGDGSPSLPFQSLQRAFQVALTGDTIHVADGTYTGAANKDLLFGGRNLRVRSVNGPAACIIDCQGQGRAFSFTQGENSSARIDGLTIQNGAASTGGLIRISAASPTIVNCSFRHGYVQQKGGAIHASNSNCVISHCLFEGNHAGPSTGVDIGGGALMLEIGAPHVSFCRFEQNSADGKGGAVLVKAVATAASIFSHCEFRMNTANTGGALFATAPNQTALWIVNSLFAGNAANHGGAVALEHSAGKIALCTFSSNAATIGGALHVSYGTSGGWKLSNSILWGNGSTQIAMEQTSALLDVSYCDIKGGQASLSPGSGTLVWGPGNVDLNPLFIDPDFRLGSASPCLDAGDNVQVPLDVLDLDGDGNTFEQLPVDLSALPRFIELPAIPNTGNGPRPLVDLGCQERQAP